MPDSEGKHGLTGLARSIDALFPPRAPAEEDESGVDEPPPPPNLHGDTLTGAPVLPDTPGREEASSPGTIEETPESDRMEDAVASDAMEEAPEPAALETPESPAGPDSGSASSRPPAAPSTGGAGPSASKQAAESSGA
ncbi:MAG: hypothetical protein R3304_12395, partial [Longimicrobiales bacterium]|nr:hypothetical protein [Longimicrobiales bacterium]